MKLSKGEREETIYSCHNIYDVNEEDLDLEQDDIL